MKAQLEKTRAELDELRKNRGGARNVRPNLAMKTAAAMKKDEGEPPEKKRREGNQNTAKHGQQGAQKPGKNPKELEATAIIMCANLLNMEALRRTKKRNFDEVAGVLAENLTVPLMRQWTGPLLLGTRNISRTTDKVEWASKALAAILKK